MNNLAPLFAGGGELFVIHRCVAAAKVERVGDHLLDTVARSGRLVVDLAPLLLVIDARPLTHHGVDERGPAAVEPLGRRATRAYGGASAAEHGETQRRQPNRPHLSIHDDPHAAPIAVPLGMTPLTEFARTRLFANGTRDSRTKSKVNLGIGRERNV